MYLPVIQPCTGLVVFTARVSYVSVQYGNRVLFVARFLPGLRAPIYMVSGITRRVSYTRFVLIDFCAAIISVPIWVYLGEFGAKNLDWLHEQIKKGQLVIYILIGILALFLFWKWKKAKKSKAN